MRERIAGRRAHPDGIGVFDIGPDPRTREGFADAARSR
jgi:hypothetical protein